MTSAKRAAFFAVCTMIPALLVHELISFAVIYQEIRWSDSECVYMNDCVGIGLVIFGKTMLAAFVGLLFGLMGALLTRASHRRIVLLSLWLILCVWMLFMTASGYRSGFGNTWLWYEPFIELMAHPIITPFVLLGGIWTFDALLRRYLPT